MVYAIQVGWGDIPHLSEASKKELLEAFPPHERDARARGVPMLGSGAIYPVAEEVWLEPPIEIPQHWPRAYGMDVGWNKTAAIWGAWDRDSDTVHLYSEHYMGKAEPQIHADAIKQRGDWIPGAIDPASGGASQLDGRRLNDEYRKLGLLLVDAENTVEAGIHAVYRRLSAGRLKIFNTLRSTVAEMRLYRRDEHGKIVKENDHLMDAMRYLIMSGMIHAITEPFDEPVQDYNTGRNPSTGY